MSHTWKLDQEGYQFAVYPGDFLIHESHSPTPWQDQQPKALARLWKNWYEFAFEVLRNQQMDFKYSQAQDSGTLSEWLLTDDPEFGPPFLPNLLNGAAWCAILAVITFAFRSFVSARPKLILPLRSPRPSPKSPRRNRKRH